MLPVLHIKSLSTSPLGCRSSLWRQQPFPQNTVCIPETLSNPCKQHSCFGKQKPQKHHYLTVRSKSLLSATSLVFPTFYWRLSGEVNDNELDCRKPLKPICILFVFDSKTLKPSAPLPETGKDVFLYLITCVMLIYCPI